MMATHNSGSRQATALAEFLNNAVTNTYTGAQIGSIVTLTDAATIAMDASLSNNFQVTLSGNRTFATQQT